MSLKNFLDRELNNVQGHIETKNMTKLQTESIINKTLTITDFDIIHNRKKNSDFCIVVFKEYENCYYMGGMVLTSLLKSLLEEENAEALAEFKQSGFSVKFLQKTSKTDNKYISLELV